MIQRQPYRRAQQQDVVPRHLALQLVEERDALAAQLHQAQQHQAQLEQALRKQVDERTALRRDTQVLEHQVRALQNRKDGERNELLETIRSLEAQLRAPQASPEPQPVEILLEAPQDDNRVLALAADLANVRRRRDEDITRQVRLERRKVLDELLGVYDSLAQALAASADTESPWHQGTAVILQQFDNALRRQGVQAIGQIGEKFNPAQHEAIGVIAQPGAPNRLAHVARTGFAFNDGELIRAAQVVVSKEV